MTNGVVGDNQESNCDLRDDGTGKVRPELDVHDSAPTRYVPYKVPKKVIPQEVQSCRIGVRLSDVQGARTPISRFEVSRELTFIRNDVGL
eukprot:8729944-Pyramimonas_sp.AAC.1